MGSDEQPSWTPLSRYVLYPFLGFRAPPSLDHIRSNQQSVDHDDEDDEQLRIAIALSQTEARETKRTRREETPDDEKQMLEE